MTDSGHASQHPVTVLGLGPMGAALASALLAAGHPTTVWNRTPAKADPLVARGATRADSLADAVTASPLVVVCVLDYQVARSLLEPAAAELRGRTVVNLTADSPDRAADLAGWTAAQGIDYLDGSIMSLVSTIGTPEGVLLVSGPEPVFRAHQERLAALGTVSYVGAEPTRAAALDVAILDVFWTAMNGVVHAYALARAYGITAQELLPHALQILQVAAEVAPELAERADAGNYHEPDSSLISNATGMAHIIHAAHAQGIDASVLAAAKEVAERAIAAGHGEGDFARLVETLAAPVP